MCLLNSILRRRQNDYRGMAELKNIRIAVSGIYEYALNELGSLQLSFSNAPDWVEEKSIYRVYRPASVLAAACQKFKLLPLTHHHPPTTVDSSNFRDLVIGYTGENPFIDYIGSADEVGIRSNVLLYDNEAQEAYARGEIQLSPGYAALFVWQKGASPHGEEYDIVMQEIKSVNHVALLPAGRGGQEARVLDAQPAQTTIFDMVHMVHTTHDKEDANGAQHSDDNGQFVGNDGGGGDNKKDKDTDDYPEKDYPQYKGTGQKAVDFLLKNKGGQVRGAFKREDIGDIDIVWGEVLNEKEHTGYGLSHIVDKHGIEAAKKIGDIIKSGKVIDNPSGRPKIEKDNFRLGLRKSWNGKQKTWIITSYQKEERGERNSKLTSHYTEETHSETSKSNIAHDSKTRKNIFECVQGTVFDWCGA